MTDLIHWMGLLGAEMVAPPHHLLRLSLFARTPTSFAAGQDIVLRDRERSQ